MVTLTRSKRRELANIVSKSKPHASSPKNAESSNATTRAPPTPRNSSLFSTGHSIDPVMMYSRQCVEDKRNCSDETTELMVAYCQAHITKWSESEWNRVLNIAISQHLDSQVYGRLGMIQLIDLLFELISCDRATPCAMSVIVQIARLGPNFQHPICDRLLESQASCSPSVVSFVTQMVTHVETRECTNFIVDLLTQKILLNSKFAISFAQQLSDTFLETFSIESFFVVQICIAHLVRELLMTDSDRSDTLISVLGKFSVALSKLLGRFASVAPALLPAALYPINDKAKEVKACNLGECVRDVRLVRPRKNNSFFIESNNLFECTVCQNLFRKSCDNCSSCPIPNCCWGCGYRMIASGGEPDAIGNSIDENLIALFLAISKLKTLDEKKFALTYSFDVAKLDLGIEKETALRWIISSKNPAVSLFAPSESFTQEIVYKLLFRDKVTFLFEMIVKSLVPLLSYSSTATIASRELRTTTAGIDISQPQMTGLTEIVFRQIQEAKDVRSLNALLSFLEHMLLSSPGAVSHISNNDILELFHIHKTRATTNTRKMIVRIFVSISDPDSCLSFLDHLSSELYSDWTDLFDQWIQCLWERSVDDSQSFWPTALPAIANNFFVRDRLEHSLSADQRYELALAQCRLGTNFDIVEYLVSFPMPTQSETLINELLHEVLSFDSEENMVSILNALTRSIEQLTSPSLSTQLHARVYEKLRRLIFLSKKLSVVGSGAKLLVVLTTAYDFSVELITEVATICINSLSERAARIRAAVILSSMIQKMDLKTIGYTSLMGWVDRVLECLSNFSKDASVPLVSSLLSNVSLREQILDKLGNFFERAIQECSDTTIACLAAVLESALTSSGEVSSSPPPNIGDRPDQGVQCRLLAPLFPLVQSIVFSSSSSETVYNAIRAIRGFVQLGIVNPRTVRSILMSRYVVSFPCDDIGLLNTQDLNMFSIRDMQPLEPALMRFTLTSFIANVIERVSTDGLVSEIYRFVELSFPETHKLLNKEGGRICLDYCVKQLVDSPAVTLREEQLAFLASVVIIGSISLDCVSAYSETLSATSSGCLDGEFSCVRFSLMMMQKKNKENITDRFGFIEECVDKFKTGEIEDLVIPEIAVTRKRNRQSVSGPRKSKRRKREAEYTSGDDSEHDVDN